MFQNSILEISPMSLYQLKLLKYHLYLWSYHKNVSKILRKKNAKKHC